MHQQTTLQQQGGIATTISGFATQNGTVNTIAFMPQTALSAMQAQQHVSYNQVPFQQQVAAAPPSQQPMKAQQQPTSSQQQASIEQDQIQKENQETPQPHDDSSRVNAGHGGPSASAAKPQGYAAAAASSNGTPSFSKQLQTNNETQDTMSKIDDWNAEDAGYSNSGNSEQRGDNRNAFRNGNSRGFRGGRGGDRGGRGNQNGGYRGAGGFRGSERGERSNGRGEFTSRRGGGGRGGGSGERNDRGGRSQDRPAVRGDRGKEFRGGDRGSNGRGRGDGARGRSSGNPMSNGFQDQKVHA